MHSPLTWRGPGWPCFGVGERKAVSGKEVNIMDETKQTISREQRRALAQQLMEAVEQFDALLDMLEKRQVPSESRYPLLNLMEQTVDFTLTTLNRWVSRVHTIVHHGAE